MNLRDNEHLAIPDFNQKLEEQFDILVNESL